MTERNRWGECATCGKMGCGEGCPAQKERARKLEEADRRRVPVSPGELMLRLLGRL